MIYLDNSATTRTMGVAAEAAKKYMTEEFFNPAAAYSPAVREERAVNGARRTIGSAALKATIWQYSDPLKQCGAGAG